MCIIAIIPLMISTFISYLVKNQFVAGILFLALAWIIFQIKEVILALFASYIIMAALKPSVLWLQSKKIPRIVAILVSYLLVLSLLVLLIFPLVPFFAEQVQQLLINFPVFVNSAAEALGVKIDEKNVSQILQFDSLSKNAFAFAGGIFGALFSIIAVFAISFYMLLEYAKIEKALLELFPENKRARVGKIIEQVDRRLGAWLRGQIVLSLFIGIITWIVLTLLQLGQYALPLAVLAGILEIIPTVGPILAAIPAVIIGLSISPNLALIMVVVYAGIQLIENNVLVPRIMQRAVGMSPIVVILGITIGGKFFGIAGALLSIPLISLLVIIYKNVRGEKS